MRVKVIIPSSVRHRRVELLPRRETRSYRLIFRERSCRRVYNLVGSECPSLCHMLSGGMSGPPVPPDKSAVNSISRMPSTNPSKFGIRKLRPVTAAINCGGIFRRTLVTWRRDPARQLANTRPPSALRAFLQNQSYL